MIPKIDSEIGISVYTTKFSGCGGIIKKQNDNFAVSEVITEKAHSRICSDSGYAVYKLKKKMGLILRMHWVKFLKNMGSG